MGAVQSNGVFEQPVSVLLVERDVECAFLLPLADMLYLFLKNPVYSSL